MKLQISEDKYVEMSDASGIKYTLCLAQESPFGSNYYVAKIDKDKNLSDLLQKYNEEKIKFIIFNDVFFIDFPDEPHSFYADFSDDYMNQIKIKNQIIFAIKEYNIEYFLTYDKIFK